MFKTKELKFLTEIKNNDLKLIYEKKQKINVWNKRIKIFNRKKSFSVTDFFVFCFYEKKQKNNVSSKRIQAFNRKETK